MYFLAFLNKVFYLLRYVPIFFILVYRYCISPLFPARCRFIPSCSVYAIEALRRYGVVKGGWLAIIRLCKCHPFHPGGYDPVK